MCYSKEENQQNVIEIRVATTRQIKFDVWRFGQIFLIKSAYFDIWEKFGQKVSNIWSNIKHLVKSELKLFGQINWKTFFGQVVKRNLIFADLAKHQNYLTQLYLQKVFCYWYFFSFRFFLKIKMCYSPITQIFTEQIRMFYKVKE